MKNAKVKLITAFLSLCSFTQAVEVTNAADITYDNLLEWGGESQYNDYVRHFKKLFELTKIKTFLEFGVNYSTKYFLDSCNKVISTEFINPGYGPEGMKSFVSLYRDYSNWIPILHYSSLSDTFAWAPYKYAASEWIYKAVAYQSATHKSYADIDNFYLQDLGHYIGQLTKSSTINIAFVNAPTSLRGDLVQLLFGKVPIIVANDTNVRVSGLKDDFFGYSRIVTPDNYEEIYLRGGPGTTIWLLKNDKNQNLIEEMTSYSKQL